MGDVPCVLMRLKPRSIEKGRAIKDIITGRLKMRVKKPNVEENSLARRIIESPYLANPLMHDAFIEPSEMPWALRPDAFSMRKPGGLNPNELQNVNLLLRTQNRITTRETNRMGQRVSE